jgi:hypothetical protein
MQDVPIFCSDRHWTEAQLSGCRQNFAGETAVTGVKSEAGRTF